MPDDMPQIDFSAMKEAATQLHELFLTMVQSGFEPKDALYLLGVMVANMAKGGDPDAP